MTTAADHHHDHDQEIYNKVTFGFWVYIMTDFIMFASMFTAYAVLRNNVYGGPGIADMSSLCHVLVVTLILLVSGLTCSLALVSRARNSVKGIQFWLAVTLILGLVFWGMEYQQLSGLVHNGITWQGSAFLSAYFTTIGLFGVHLTVALLWAIILMVQLASQGLTATIKRRLSCLSLFWHFLNMVWILIFTIVYLAGAI